MEDQDGAGESSGDVPEQAANNGQTADGAPAQKTEEAEEPATAIVLAEEIPSADDATEKPSSS
eukprot:1183799-Prorocentrum_minimum.AAC.5